MIARRHPGVGGGILGHCRTRWVFSGGVREKCILKSAGPGDPGGFLVGLLRAGDTGVEGGSHENASSSKEAPAIVVFPSFPRESNCMAAWDAAPRSTGPHTQISQLSRLQQPITPFKPSFPHNRSRGAQQSSFSEVGFDGHRRLLVEMQARNLLICKSGQLHLKIQEVVNVAGWRVAAGWPRLYSLRALGRAIAYGRTTSPVLLASSKNNRKSELSSGRRLSTNSGPPSRLPRDMALASEQKPSNAVEYVVCVAILSPVRINQ